MRTLLAALLSLAGACSSSSSPQVDSPPDARSARAGGPNVVLIMTDDQGWGDFGFHGDPVLRTPNLDAMAQRSARLTNFYVSPVCTPTRAALMTGRWPQRTRAFDTYLGRAMMEPDEVTVAEILRQNGWATGIFGKWHLGDCYPMRAIDQGFDEALVHRGGGIGQPSDPPGGEGRYTDAVLFHNGERVGTDGYCTDVYFDAAIDWMRGRHAEGRPFFAYVATNAPHSPLRDVPEQDYDHYRAEDLSPARYPATEGHALPDDWDSDVHARIFAMIDNIDANVGKLFAALDAMGAVAETLVVFLVDNGPNTLRWVGGMRGKKGDVHEGGVRSPFFAHWPGRLEAGDASDRIAAHVDVMPTILDACGIAAPDSLDGRSVLPLLERRSGAWPDRTLVIQAHRGDRPVRNHHCLVRTQRWKLVNPSGFGKTVDALAVEPHWELYDMVADPLELLDVAAEHPDVVDSLVARYDAWFTSIEATRRDPFAPPRIVVGAEVAPRVVLTRQDWRRTSHDGGWGSRGHWLVDVVHEGPFDVLVRFPGGDPPVRATLRCGGVERSVEVPVAGGASLTIEGVELPRGPAAFEVVLERGDSELGAYQVEITPVG